jgi:hypothetical protein
MIAAKRQNRRTESRGSILIVKKGKLRSYRN